MIILCRNQDKAKEAADEISGETGNDVAYEKLDLAALASGTIHMRHPHWVQTIITISCVTVTGVGAQKSGSITDMSAYSDTLGERQKCHCKRGVTVTICISWLPHDNFGPLSPLLATWRSSRSRRRRSKRRRRSRHTSLLNTLTLKQRDPQSLFFS